MAAKNRPYEQFGSFILFKKLETDALGDLWRAGRIEGSQLGEVVALRRLTGGNREAFVSSAGGARQVVPQLTGTSFAKHQEIDIVNGVPYIAHEYGGGRSLRHIIDRARGGNGVSPNPLPIDQAIVIAEKVALSLSTIADLKMADRKLAHGALVPQFIWINDDGEIRVAGQQLGGGFFASLRDAAFASHFGRYFSPEYRTNGEPTKASEVFALGAILYLLITGSEPPDAMTASAFMLAIRGAKTMTGPSIPDDIRVILDKSLNLDVNARYASVADMKQALSALAHGGKYSATTFNLAFYLNSLLKKEMEGEALERDKEGKVNVAAYLEQPAPAVAAATATPLREETAPPPMFGVTDEPKKSKAPLAIAAIVVLAVLGAGGWLLMRPAAKPTAPTAAAAPKPQPPPPQKVQMIPTAVVAATTTAPAAAVDPAAQQKAFEAAVEQKLQSEMMKLQADYTKNLQKTQSKNAPVQIAAAAPVPVPAAATPEEHAPPSAAALDEKRLSATRQEPPAPAPAPTQTSAPAPAPVTPTVVPASIPAPQVAQVREGDVIDYNELDSPVNPLSAIRPSYPPLAMRSKIESSIILTALIDENGNVVDVKVLRGDERFGFNEAAIRAMRGTRFSQPTKNGRRVKTWRPQMIVFKL
jgi:TonB family protein